MTSKNESAENGAVWERYVVMECRELEKRGHSKVSKNWEAPPIPGTKKPRAKSKPDFSGCLRGGRHVVFEAKSTEEPERFDLKNLAKHQREHLLDAAFLGSVAFVYVVSRANREDRKYIIPVAVIESTETKSVRFDAPGVVEKLERETWFDALVRGGLA
jgi:penicillin-binding protein-related factor A (putative recombinase)